LVNSNYMLLKNVLDDNNLRNNKERVILIIYQNKVMFILLQKLETPMPHFLVYKS